MNAWPATLPQYVRKPGFQSGLGDGRARSDTDAGIAKMRRRFSYVPRPLTVSLKLTQAQLDIFTSFIENDIAGGTLPFTFPVVSFDGSGGAWTVQIGKDMPSWAPEGLGYIVTLNLVVLP